MIFWFDTSPYRPEEDLLGFYMTHSTLIGSEIYRHSTYGAKHPISIPRVSTVLDLVRALKLCPAENYKNAPTVKIDLLAQFHSRDYLVALLEAETSQFVSETDRKAYNIGVISNPVFPSMFKRPATSVGSSLLATELVAVGGRAYALGGGLHHGMADYANGFCFMNDIVFAIKNLRKLGRDRVAYVDLDAHHCDGVEAAFLKDPNLLIISTHEEKRWPFTGQININQRDKFLNIPLPRGCNDDEFYYVFDKLISPSLKRFSPDALIIQGGGDALYHDPLSRLGLSNNALWWSLRRLVEFSSCLILTGGGGYNPWTVARLWTGFWAILSAQCIPQMLTPEAEAILASLKWKKNFNPPNYLLASLFDPPFEGKVREEIRDLVFYLKNLHEV